MPTSRTCGGTIMLRAGSETVSPSIQMEPFGDFLQTCDAAQRRAFAAARRSEQRDEFALCDLERYALDDAVFHESFGDAADNDAQEAFLT